MFLPVPTPPNASFQCIKTKSRCFLPEPVPVLFFALQKAIPAGVLKQRFRDCFLHAVNQASRLYVLQSLAYATSCPSVEGLRQGLARREFCHMDHTMVACLAMSEYHSSRYGMGWSFSQYYTFDG